MTVQSGGRLTPHVSGGTVSTLTIGSAAAPGTLNLNAGSILNFSMAGSNGNDLVQLNGNLALGSGADVLNLNGLTGFSTAYGVYPLVAYTGTLTDGAPTWTVNPTGTAPTGSQHYAVLTPTGGGLPGQLTLIFSSGASPGRGKRTPTGTPAPWTPIGPAARATTAAAPRSSSPTGLRTPPSPLPAPAWLPRA